MGFTLLFVGLGLALGGFIFGAVNMGRAIKDDGAAFHNMAKRHIVAMVALALGGGVALIGGIMIVMQVLTKAGWL